MGYSNRALVVSLIKKLKITDKKKTNLIKKEMEIVHTRNLGRLYHSTKVYWLEYFVISLAIMLIIMYA